MDSERRVRRASRGAQETCKKPMDLHRRLKLITADFKERHLKSVFPFEVCSKNIEKNHSMILFLITVRSETLPRAPRSPRRASHALPVHPGAGGCETSHNVSRFSRGRGPPRSTRVLPGLSSPLPPRHPSYSYVTTHVTTIDPSASPRAAPRGRRILLGCAHGRRPLRQGPNTYFARC